MGRLAKVELAGASSGANSGATPRTRGHSTHHRNRHCLDARGGQHGVAHVTKPSKLSNACRFPNTSIDSFEGGIAHSPAACLASGLVPEGSYTVERMRKGTMTKSNRLDYQTT